jgi:hypothetical protein
MSFAPNLFLSNMRAKDGPAKPSRFEVILPIPPYINNFVSQSIFEKLVNLPNTIVSSLTDIFATQPQDEQSKTSNASLSRYLALQCETAELPGKTLMTQDAKVYGPTFKVPYLTQYNDITLGFLSTNDFYERKLFDRWLEAINPSDTNNLRFAKGESTRYMTNIKVIQYDDFIKQIYAVELIDAFPIGVSAQPLSWSEDNFHRVSVQFSYQKYRVIYDGNYDLAQAAATILGLKTVNFTNNTGNSIMSGIGRATSVFGKLF